MADYVWTSTTWTQDLNYTDPFFGTNANFANLYLASVGISPRKTPLLFDLGSKLRRP